MEAWGTFVSKGQHMYRTSAYIQWGISKKPVGAALMLNPGSASLQLPVGTCKEQQEGLINLDPTMLELIGLVEEVHQGKKVEGRLYIYNLFCLQNPKNKNALTELDDLWLQGEKLVRELPEDRKVLLNKFKTYPWVLIGWGCGQNSVNIHTLKMQWYSLLKDSGVCTIGKRGKNEWDYYHPLQRIAEKRAEYRNEILVQFKNQFKKEPSLLGEGINVPSCARKAQSGEFNQDIDKIETKKDIVQYKLEGNQGNSKNKESSNLINIGDRIEHRRGILTRNIREYDDRYEYCIIPEYEEKYSVLEAHSIQLREVSPVVLEINGKIILASIEFYKDKFTIEQMIGWLEVYKIYLGQLGANKYRICDCSQVIDGLKFKGNILVLYQKGHGVIQLTSSDYLEITDFYISNLQEIDTGKSKSIQKGLTIRVNGEIVNEISRFDFDIRKDTIVSNGNCIVADYIGEYCGGIGFYRDDDASIPIVFILDYNTTIDIEITQKENGSKVCIVEHKYLIEVDKL